MKIVDLEGLKNKNVIVLGMGRSGVASATFLKEKGANVLVNDKKPETEVLQTMQMLEAQGIRTIAGEHPLKLLEGIDFIVKSPGIPNDIPFLIEATKCSIPIISEIELGYLYTKSQIIAITGTNGKTTTATLINEILKNDDRETFLAGNVGTPLTQVVGHTSVSSFLVVEVSSFQLEHIQNFKPQISIILNLTQDHINIHKTVDNYIKAKTRIFENQDEEDFVILNADDETVLNLISNIRSKIVFLVEKELDYGVLLKIM